MPRLSKIGAAALAAFGWTSGVSAVSASYLVVAGGGGGGVSAAGGGGAGGFQTGTTSLNPTLSYTVTVGAGGVSGNTGSGTSSPGTNGSNSVFNAITSTGGGGGGAETGGAGNGGSGGGGGYATSAGTGTSGQGNNGGAGTTNFTNFSGGGGGGAGATGGNASDGVGGNGGNGTASSITGSSVTYAGGGGGGGYTGGGGGTAGTGGTGGGGAGGTRPSGTGTSGTANLGGGGGGSGNNSSVGGAGGSGVVIISYVGAQQFGGGVVTSSGGNTIHTFTTSGTLSPLNALTASYLIVAGGGGGGGEVGGGGGAGGYLTGSSLTIDTNSVYVVTVGAGGTAGPNASSQPGGSGGNSLLSIVSTTAIGGGGGGTSNTGVAATNGGSGGGGGGFGSAAGTGTAGQGNNGGAGNGGAPNYPGGGGGGAGSVGGNSGPTTAGTGGTGSSSSISGSSVTYAAGGAGGLYNTGNSNGSNASANTGNGGGGANANGGGTGTIGGTGGSGIVIISYPGSTQQMAGGTVTVAGGNVIHTFTSSGYLTPIVLVTNSLRFRNSASAYLSRTPSSNGSTTTFTFSAWVKRGRLDIDGYLFSAVKTGPTATDAIRFNSNGSFSMFYEGSATAQVRTSALFRDPSAWYHMVVQIDTTQATASNRVKLYCNGSQITALDITNYPSQNATFPAWNKSGLLHTIGNDAQLALYADQYMTDINFIDGQALTPNSFGTLNGLGIWQPIRYGGSYGTNGFYLPFTNTTSTTTLGFDFSPQGNNWTTNNISLTAGSTYDSMTDVPTNTSATVANYAVLNPLWSLGGSGYITPTNGNLRASIGGSYNIIASTISLPSTGKWYMEFTLTTGVYAEYGLCSATASGGGTNAGVFAAYYNGVAQYALINGSATLTDGNQAWVSGDIGLIAVDVDNNKVWLGRNRSGTVVWMGGGNPSAGTSPSFSAAGGGGVYSTAFNAQTFNNPFVASGGGSDVWDANFGQQPFVGTPPTNFNRLNTFNLPTPTIGATASTTANKYFNAVTYTGAGAGTVITSGFYPDFAWMKNRTAAFSNFVQDSVRGGGVFLLTDTTDADSAVSPSSTFSSTGITINANSSYASNSSYNYVLWAWNANSGSTVTNTNGSIISTVSANTTAGFSVVTYTGNGTAGATVGHGLGVAPSMVIIKQRTNASGWPVWHTSLTSGAYYLYLQTSNAQSNVNAMWNNTAPNSTVITLGTSTDSNENTANLVAYCFAQVAGYSAFGSYTGNGSSDGPFIFTGFRPRYLMIKRSDSTADWNVRDTARSPYNVVGEALYPNLSFAEYSASETYLDILSNGFKLRGNWNSSNASGGTYIYMAFAESPFKYANAR
jgi:hypothetical protein